MFCCFSATDKTAFTSGGETMYAPTNNSITGNTKAYSKLANNRYLIFLGKELKWFISDLILTGLVFVSFGIVPKRIKPPIFVKGGFCDILYLVIGQF